jgi:hypothetical protein
VYEVTLIIQFTMQSVQHSSVVDPQQLTVNAETTLCSICQKIPAAVGVAAVEASADPTSMPHGARKRKQQSQQSNNRNNCYYCLLHYYCSSAVRGTEQQQHTSILDPFEFNRQLPPMQALFADVFVQVANEISEESARAFTEINDPLAIVKRLSHRKKTPATKQLNSGKAGGGFLTHVPVPQRLVMTQREQARKQAAMTKRMEEAAKHSQASQRRKTSRASVWNVARDDTKKGNMAPPTSEALEMTAPQNNGITCTSCGSQTVECLATNSNRNSDSHKGETWGSKDRAGDVISRYQCLACGKVWNEEE